MSADVMESIDALSLVNEPPEIVLADDKPPLIPEGEYNIAYIRHETAMVFKTPKIFVHFKIVDLGPYCGITLYRAFRARSLIDKPRKNGRFKLGRRSELYLTICKLYESQGLRPDRISLHHLKALVLKARIRTVTKDSRQRLLPECEHYSVVGEILDISAGVVKL